MAKKKKSIDLRKEAIEYTQDDIHYTIIRFYPDKMTLDLIKSVSQSTQKESINLPFAHLPKAIKKIIKPN